MPSFAHHMVRLNAIVTRNINAMGSAVVAVADAAVGVVVAVAGVSTGVLVIRAVSVYVR